MALATTLVLAHIAAAMLLAAGYFRRYTLARPPIGVLNLWDTALLLGAIILVPFLYLTLPTWLVVALLALAVVSVVYLVWEPILRARWLIWLTALALAAADSVIARLLGPTSTAFFAVNNVVLTVVIIGITNLWAQSGMPARHVALLAGLLAIYDVIVTWQLSQMANLLNRLLSLPFAPIIGWPTGDAGQWLGIGMGDMLLATVFPLAMRKAFGRSAGVMALALNLGAMASLLLVVSFGGMQELYPAMIILGPLMLAQYAYWRRRRGPERTMWQYRHAALR